MKTRDKINYTAEEGKVFIRKSDNQVMGYGLGLGSLDNIDNYEEIDCPEEFVGKEGYDNTISNEELNAENIIDYPFPRYDA